jgi:hypothetical protein
MKDKEKQKRGYSSNSYHDTAMAMAAFFLVPHELGDTIVFFDVCVKV